MISVKIPLPSATPITCLIIPPLSPKPNKNQN
jgi:hypothetical protein